MTSTPDPTGSPRVKVLPFPRPKADVPADVAPAAEPALAFEPSRYDRITVRVITIAIAISLFIHFAILFLPLIDKTDKEMKAPADEIGPLSVSIAQTKPPPPGKQPDQPPASQPTPAVKPTPRPPSKQQPTPRPAPRIAITGDRPPFIVPPPPVAPAPEVAPSPTPAPTDDFSDMVAQRQRARRAQNGGAPDQIEESEDQRANRIAQGNVKAQQRSASPGQDPAEAGGLFDLRRTGLRDAEFVFYGWNQTVRRAGPRVFEVRQGSNPDIRIAVIRAMIDIIREQKPGDFEWESHRLGKVLTMSARPKDQAQLETFLMREFFPEDARAR